MVGGRYNTVGSGWNIVGEIEARRKKSEDGR